MDGRRARMRYPGVRKLGLFVGSSVIEASCKTVTGPRLKQSGMLRTVRDSNAIVVSPERRFENYTEIPRSARTPSLLCRTPRLPPAEPSFQKYSAAMHLWSREKRIG